MAFKFIIALAFVAVASAGVIPVHQEYHAAPQAYAAPQTYAVAQPAYGKSEESYDSHPKYQFSYAVHDQHTGDIKSHSESRDGDVVQGEYSLVDSDGHKRIVHYTADHHNGFNAVVHREPLGYEVKATPAVYAAPAGIKSAPVAYAAAPVLQYGHASQSHDAAQAYNYHH